jgi:hypothetical protein
MNHELDHEIQQWDREVDAEAARLIREGASPLEAAMQASDNVSKKRQKEARRKHMREILGDPKPHQR